jgi:hypothetical protein
MEPEQKKIYGLQAASNYLYMNQGGSVQIDSKMDTDDFHALVSSMEILSFSRDEQDTIFKILAAVLHMGNVYFVRKKVSNRTIVYMNCVPIYWIFLSIIYGSENGFNSHSGPYCAPPGNFSERSDHHHHHYGHHDPHGSLPNVITEVAEYPSPCHILLCVPVFYSSLFNFTFFC